MLRKSTFVWPLCGLLALAASAPLFADEGPKDAIEAQMELAHVGTKDGPAPLGVVIDQLASDSPDWSIVAKNNEALAEMAKLIEQVPENDKLYRFSKKSSYPTAVAALLKATTDEDHAAARTALTGVTTSCRGCHFYGGCATMLPDLDKVVGRK